jgi:glycolate oxidase FAD binding subunit
MTLTASSVADVTAALLSASARDEKISTFDLRSMRGVLEYTPEDMTVSVEAGVTLAQLQGRLAEHNQWLPMDPPGADTLTMGVLLAANRSGPRRFGHGTVREHLLGIKVVLADGRVIKAGGKVVKNVAGYDLCKLFVGSQGTLGVIVEATFKVLPRPESELFLKRASAHLDELAALLQQVNQSPLTPVVLDLHGSHAGHNLVLGFAGPREDVEWQREQARALGFMESAALEYDEAFRQASEPFQVASVLPSKVIETIKALEAQSYVARAGNGLIYFRGGRPQPRPDLPLRLLRRIKETYDPKGILPKLPW